MPGIFTHLRQYLPAPFTFLAHGAKRLYGDASDILQTEGVRRPVARVQLSTGG